MMRSDWKRSKSISDGKGEVDCKGESEGEGEVEGEVECETRRNLKGGGKLFSIVKMCTSDLKSVPVIATMQTITERPRMLAIDCNSTFHSMTTPHATLPYSNMCTIDIPQDRRRSQKLTEGRKVLKKRKISAKERKRS